MSGREWLGDHRAACMLSFDVDCESAVLNVDPALAARPMAMSHQAYGATVGVPRLLRELERAGVAGTFFIPGYTAERYPDMVRAIDAAGHEIGCHGYLHESPSGLSRDEERAILVRSVEVLERLLGRRPVGYRAPLADPSPSTVELLAELGFRYDSSLSDDDRPYVYETAAGALAELPINWGLDDWEQYAFLVEPDVGQQIETPGKVLELWREEMEAIHEEGLLFVGIMHPELSGRPSRARVLRRFVEYAKGLPDVWFATGSQLADAIQATTPPTGRRRFSLPEPPGGGPRSQGER